LSVLTLAEKMERRSLPRAVIPRIALVSPKITHKLTTDWYALHVNQRYVRCLALDSRVSGQASR
jgi:hypothetical protein